MKSSINVGFDGSVEPSKVIVSIGTEVSLLLEIVFLVLLAYGVDSEQNVDNTHLVVVSGSSSSRKRKRATEEIFGGK